ncbi:hypothetical protein FA048_03800 [Pedobacter polaris]|uniref:Uncharacterized protein n=1 Tax=Pedobacter polaris TaxID=2571273 RepID=A0A4U1CV99_9SPHI|nr:hypothetical protein [Pedobacter polaris]TKC12753.1 hypothetical protein FA048_03800 [Pedobacter polaris]
MPEDYRKVVFEAYEKRKLEGKLSSNLLDATPGNLREECLIVCRERYTPQDHEILRLFFSNGDKEKGYLNILENTAAETFKQMSNVLRGGVKKPGIKYFELLAWLMDFHPKTSTAYYKSFYEVPKVKDASVIEENLETNHVNGEVEEVFSKPDKAIAIEKNETGPSALNQPQEITDDEKDKPTTPVIILFGDSEVKGAELENPKDLSNIDVSLGNLNPPSQHSEETPGKQSLSNKNIIVTGIIVLFIGLSTFLFWQDKEDRETITKDEKCMFWTGDHYEATLCNQKTNAPKIDLNIQTLNGLKKITQPDTLTQNSLGKVWYATINNKKEFFTDSGMHPVDTVKRLKPLTPYILTNYVSYYRYLLTILIWSICIIISIVILVVALVYQKRRYRIRLGSKMNEKGYDQPVN